MREPLIQNSIINKTLIENVTLDFLGPNYVFTEVNEAVITEDSDYVVTSITGEADYPVMTLIEKINIQISEIFKTFQMQSKIGD